MLTDQVTSIVQIIDHGVKDLVQSKLVVVVDCMHCIQYLLYV